MAQRISEQVVEYLTVGGNGFTPQTSLPLMINGRLAINAENASLSSGVWPITWLLTPNSNDFTIAKNVNDEGIFSSTKPSFKINSDAVNIGKKLLLSVGMNGGGFNLSDGTGVNPVTTGLFYIKTLGTVFVPGTTTISAGNSKATGNTNNAAGELQLYSSSTGSGTIYQVSTTQNRSHKLPDQSGWLVKAANSGVGNETTPVYISSSGIATQGKLYAGGTSITLNNIDKTATTASFYAPTTGGTAGYILKANGDTSTPTWLQILPVANGGTGNTTFTANRLTYSSSAGQLSSGNNLYTDGARLVVNGASFDSNDDAFQVEGSSYLKGELWTAGAILPDTNEEYDLGLSDSRWNNIYGNLIGNADTATKANFPDGAIPNSLAYYTDAQGTFGASNLIQINDNGLMTTKTANAQVEYKLQNKRNSISLAIKNTGISGLLNPEDNTWFLQINNPHTLMTIPMTLKPQALDSYYSKSSAVSSFNSGFSALYSANYGNITESGMYLVSISLNFGTGFEYHWGGILPIKTPTQGTYTSKYLIGTHSGQQGDGFMLTADGIGSQLVNLYFQLYDSSYGSIIWIQSNSGSSYSINSSKISLLKIANLY